MKLSVIVKLQRVVTRHRDRFDLALNVNFSSFMGLKRRESKKSIFFTVNRNLSP
jgi:hypothetical protein